MAQCSLPEYKHLQWAAARLSVIIPWTTVTISWIGRPPVSVRGKSDNECRAPSAAPLDHRHASRQLPARSPGQTAIRPAPPFSSVGPVVPNLSSYPR